MRSTPKLVMGVTLIMGVSLLLLLALLLVLFAELYCSLLRKRRPPLIVIAAAAQEGSEEDPPSAEPLPMSLCLGHSAYSHGVLCAPRGFHFPFIKEQHQQSHHSDGSNLHFMGLISTSSSPTPSHALSQCPPAPPRLTTIASAFEELNSAIEDEDTSRNFDSTAGGQNFIYISNPIYDNNDEAHDVDTPFETPDTSPSCLPLSDADDSEGSPSPRANYTPPLTPMKKLPATASSVTLVHGRSLIASVSATDSNKGSSSSSDSPSTSPSW